MEFPERVHDLTGYATHAHMTAYCYKPSVIDLETGTYKVDLDKVNEKPIGRNEFEILEYNEP